MYEVLTLRYAYGNAGAPYRIEIEVSFLKFGMRPVTLVLDGCFGADVQMLGNCSIRANYA